MAVLAMLLFIVAFIVSLIVRAVEILEENGSKAFKYMKDTWESDNNEVRNL